MSLPPLRTTPGAISTVVVLGMAALVLIITLVVAPVLRPILFPELTAEAPAISAATSSDGRRVDTITITTPAGLVATCFLDHTGPTPIPLGCVR